MNPKVKLVLYVVLAAGLVFFGYKTFSIRDGADDTAPASETNSATNTVVATNLGPATNVAETTNTAGGTNPAGSTNEATPASVAASSAEEPTARRASARVSRLMAYGGAALLSLVGLAILFSQDASRFVANRVNDFIFNDDLEGVKDPEYEEAEEVWKKGDHLEAIRLMRDYLKRHPREQYVALRIAEIYEANLRNHLAAALEYEEILKKKLPAERWGWAAIHLANLYSGKLNKTPEAEALLHRIIKEYGQTAAAKKARERLGVPEFQPQPASVAPHAPPEPVSEKPKPSDSNLPPGFRPKK
jgi:TolA-binding protein